MSRRRSGSIRSSIRAFWIILPSSSLIILVGGDHYLIILGSFAVVILVGGISANPIFSVLILFLLVTFLDDRRDISTA